MSTHIRLSPFLFAAVFAGLTGCGEDQEAAGVTPRQRPSARVVVISVDGLRPDAIRLAPAPAIMELASRGSYTWDAQTIRPSVTLPSHTSMMTGASPREHGILWNDYRAGHVKETTPTVFALASQAGVRSVLVSGKEKFYALAPPGGANVFVWASGGDMDVAASAVAEIERGFGMALIHLPGTDDMGHAQSWMSPSYLAQVRAADAAVTQILQKLPPDTIVILSADHGGFGNNHAEDIPENTTIPWIIAGPGVRKNHPLTYDVWTTDTAGTVAHALGLRLPTAAIGRPVEEAFESFKGGVESCGSVPNDGAIVMEQALPESAPTPAGGTPAAGVYQLTAATVYAAGCVTRPVLTGRRYKTAIRIEAEAGGTQVMEHVEGSIGGGGFGGGVTCGEATGGRVGGQGGGGGMQGAIPVAGPERRSRFRLAAAGSRLERRRLCSRIVEPGTNLTDDYTATADEILFFRELQVGRDTRYPLVFTYSRVP